MVFQEVQDSQNYVVNSQWHIHAQKTWEKATREEEKTHVAKKVKSANF